MHSFVLSFETIKSLYINVSEFNTVDVDDPVSVPHSGHCGIE